MHTSRCTTVSGGVMTKIGTVWVHVSWGKAAGIPQWQPCPSSAEWRRGGPWGRSAGRQGQHFHSRQMNGRVFVIQETTPPELCSLDARYMRFHTLWNYLLFGNMQNKNCDVWKIYLTTHFLKNNVYMCVSCKDWYLFSLAILTTLIVITYPHFCPLYPKILKSWSQSGWGLAAVSLEYSLVRMLRMQDFLSS